MRQAFSAATSGMAFANSPQVTSDNAKDPSLGPCGVFAEPRRQLLNLEISRFCRCLAGFLVISLALVSSARGAIVAPASLDPGDQFRLVFVTEFTRSATSDDLADYDAFVFFSALLAGLTTYEGTSVNWYTLGSTATVNANDRLPDSSVPIYELDGTLVASPQSNLWTIPGLLSQIDTTEYGTTKVTQVWTGTDRTGNASPGDALGSSRPQFGITTTPIQLPWFWTEVGNADAATMLSLYAFSDVLTVPQGETPPPPPAPAPEPSTLWLLAMGAGVVGARWRRSRATP